MKPTGTWAVLIYDHDGQRESGIYGLTKADAEARMRDRKMKARYKMYLHEEIDFEEPLIMNDGSQPREKKERKKKVVTQETIFN